MKNIKFPRVPLSEMWFQKVGHMISLMWDSTSVNEKSVAFVMVCVPYTTVKTLQWAFKTPPGG